MYNGQFGRDFMLLTVDGVFVVLKKNRTHNNTHFYYLKYINRPGKKVTHDDCCTHTKI